MQRRPTAWSFRRVAGNDTVNASGIAAGQIIVELQGGLGADTFIGSEGGDFILGGDGNDTAFMGAGDDTFTWNPGDDNDMLEGQAGTDTMDFNGASVAENITISPNGGRIIFFRDVASVGMDLNDVERIVFNAPAPSTPSSSTTFPAPTSPRSSSISPARSAARWATPRTTRSACRVPPAPKPSIVTSSAGALAVSGLALRRHDQHGRSRRPARHRRRPRQRHDQCIGGCGRHRRAHPQRRGRRRQYRRRQRRRPAVRRRRTTTFLPAAPAATRCSAATAMTG